MQKNAQLSEKKVLYKNEINSNDYRNPNLYQSQNQEENKGYRINKDKKSNMPNFQISISNPFRKDNTRIILNSMKPKNGSRKQKSRKLVRYSSPQAINRNSNIFSEIATLPYNDQVLLLNQLVHQRNINSLQENNSSNYNLKSPEKNKFNSYYPQEESFKRLNPMQGQLNRQEFINSPPSEIIEITSNLSEEIQEIKETVSQMQLNIDAKDSEIMELKTQLEAAKLTNRQNRNREPHYNNFTSFSPQPSTQYSMLEAKGREYKSIMNPFENGVSNFLPKENEYEVHFRPDQNFENSKINHPDYFANKKSNSLTEDYYIQKIKELEIKFKEKENDILKIQTKLDSSNKEAIKISERKDEEIRKLNSLLEKDQKMINNIKQMESGSDLKNQINIFQEQLSSLKSTNLILSKANENLNSQIEISELKISKLTEENDALKYINEEQKNFASQLTKEIQIMKEKEIKDPKSSHFQETINKLTFDLKLAKSNEKSMENIISDLRDKGNNKISENNELKNEFNSFIKQKEDIIVELRSEIKEKNKEIERIKNEIGNSANTFSSKSIESSKLLKENELLVKSNKELSMQINSLKEEIENNKMPQIPGKSNDKYEKKYKELKESNDVLLRAKKDLEFKLSIMLKKQKKREEDIEVLKNSVNNSSKSEIQEEDSNLKEELMNLRNKISELTSDIQSKTTQIIKLEEAAKKDKERLMESNLKSASYLQQYNDVNDELNQLKLKHQSGKKK